MCALPLRNLHALSPTPWKMCRRIRRDSTSTWQAALTLGASEIKRELAWPLLGAFSAADPRVNDKQQKKSYFEWKPVQKQGGFCSFPLWVNLLVCFLSYYRYYYYYYHYWHFLCFCILSHITQHLNTTNKARSCRNLFGCRLNPRQVYSSKAY